MSLGNLDIRWKQQVAVAKMKRAAWEHAAPSWKAQQDMFKFVIGGQQPKSQSIKPMREDDVTSWLQKHNVPLSEADKVRCVQSGRDCREARGVKNPRACHCRWVWRHSNVSTGRCWLCTAERPI